MKGRCLLLYLDDCWQDEHIEVLNLVDKSTGSCVLISTRIRGLCGSNSVEIPPPSEADAISIVMAAAGLDKDDTPPKDAASIVALCGRLPLALAMAGKLILDIDIGRDWEGVPEILRKELREHESASCEQKVIRASLGALGSGAEADNIRALFKLLGLVPEDTICPLDTLLLMFNTLVTPVHKGALTSTGRQYSFDKSSSDNKLRKGGTSLLHIRKYIKVLVDRSLVLGSVDRPQVRRAHR